MDEGPYRQSGAIACVRCETPLVADRDGLLTCTNGCGAWYPTEVFAAQLGPVLAEMRAPSTWWKKKAVVSCPVCRDELEQIGFGTAALHRCGKHGAWLDAGTRERLEQDFAGELARFRAVVALTARLASLDAEALREIAKRFVDLELRVAHLEERVARL